MTTPETETQTTLASLRADEWQRLAPAAIIHFMVKFLVGFAKNGIQNVAYLGGIAVFTGDHRWMILGSIAAGALAFLLIAGTLSYLNFRFRLDGRAFLIQRGVLNKKRLTLAFDRIQNVAVKEPIYFKPFGLVALGLESAGSSSEEVSLAGIPRSLALDIRKAVLTTEKAKPADADTAAPVQEEADPEENLLLAQPVSELVRYGLSNNNIWVITGLVTGAIFQQADAWEGAAEDYVRSSVIPVVGNDPVILGTLLGGVILFIILFLMSLSVVGAIVVHYNFRLSFSDGRYHRTKGLFERQETSVPETKIQSLQIHQPWPALLLKRWHLALKQVGFAKNRNHPSARQASFIIPSVTPEFYQGFANHLFGPIDWSLDLRSVDTLYAKKTLLYFFIMPAVTACLVLNLTVGMVGFLALLLPVLAMPIVVQRWRRYGYWSNGTAAIIQRGFIGRRLTVFTFHKVQSVALTQSPSQRKRDLATLTIDLAGQTLKVPYMPLSEAHAWRDRILYEVETSKIAWM